MNTHWTKDGPFYKLQSINCSENLPRLNPGVYVLQMNKQGFFLEERPGGFEMPEKIYGLEEAFIHRVVHTFRQTDRNMGVLLTGIRGTGKTVTAETIAIQLGLPIILIMQDYPGIIDFIDTIPHDCTYLVDEFEKVFSMRNPGEESISGGSMEAGPSKLLPIMDGALNSKHRKVFILTTNRLTVEPNLLQRPGRIRYLRNFTNLSRESIEMLVDDLLTRKELRTETITFLARMEIITIDLVKAVIEEMNIHGGSPEALEGVMNIKMLDKTCDVTMMEADSMKEGERFFNVAVTPFPLTPDEVGERLYLRRQYVGDILEVDGEYVTLDRTEWNHDHREVGGDTIPRPEKIVIRVRARHAYNAEVFGKGYKGE